eukprot:COSAG03_NODE_3011_length_2287_cov_9.147166_2_plen_327_part_00
MQALLSLALLSAAERAVSSGGDLSSSPLGRTLLIANGSASTGAVTTFGTVTKDARNPLLKIGAQRKVDQDPKRPWSTGGIYSAIVVDQTGKRSGKPWRAYFTAGLNWTLSPQCPPGATCETGAAGLLYAESEDGIAWEQPNVGLMWPPFAANGTQQTRSDILRLVEAGTAVFEDENPAVRAGKSDEEWSIKFVGQLSMKDDSKMHSGGSGEYLTSSDGRTFDGAGSVDVDGGRTPGARWDTENNFFFDHSTVREWLPSCLPGIDMSSRAGTIRRRDEGASGSPLRHLVAGVSEALQQLRCWEPHRRAQRSRQRQGHLADAVQQRLL